MADASKDSSAKGQRRVLGVTALALINVAAVLSLRNFAELAIYGWSSIFWYLLGTITFLIPTSLIGAELATGWPEAGGVYAWVRRAWGDQPGFLAIWCEWAENIVWFPTVLAYVAATLAFALNPDLTSDPVYMATVMLVIFWGTTFFNFLGTRASAALSSIGTTVGTIIPGTLIILLGIAYLVQGNASQIGAPSASNLVPSFSLSNLAFAASIVLVFAGMEMAGFHATETRNPQRDFPRAILMSALIIFTVTVLGTIAIAIVVPSKDIGLAGGLMQAFEAFLHKLNIGWAATPVAILLVVGAVAQLSTWLVGPAKGLQPVAMQGDLPPVFRKMNKRDMPVGVLIIQAVLSSVFVLLMVLLPSVNTGYWVLSALTSQVFAIMYILMFSSVIRLRITQPDTPRAYKIPGGMAGVWIVAGVGLVSMVFALVVGFIPPSQVETGSPVLYTVGMIAGVVLLAGPPFLFHRFRRPSWQPTAEEIAADEAGD